MSRLSQYVGDTDIITRFWVPKLRVAVFFKICCVNFIVLILLMKSDLHFLKRLMFEAHVPFTTIVF